VKQLYDEAGSLVTLQRELGRGGEGSVFESREIGRDAVAKVYHDPLPTDKQSKLRAMVRLGNGHLRQIAAWPTQLLLGQKGGAVAGFLMARVEGYQPIHNLSSPASRKQLFPEVNYAFLVHVARNIAASFDAVHAHGHVVGDVNENNFLVAKNGTVKLIDCDSFQISDGGTRYSCDVGVLLFTPPELQKVGSFRGRERTANHDNFGLAVLVFQLLLLGRHPFAGVPLGKADGSIEEAITGFRFAYANDRRQRQIDSPPDTLPLSFFTPEIARAFEQAFTEQGVTGRRPLARDWVSMLDSFKSSLRACGQVPDHRYPPSQASCPWCGMDSRGHPAFLARGASPKPGAAAVGGDIASLWARAQSLAILPPLAPYQSSQSAAVGKSNSYGKAEVLKYRASVSIIVLAAFFATLALPAIWIPALVVGGIALAVVKHPKGHRIAAREKVAVTARSAFRAELDAYEKLTHDPRMSSELAKLQHTKTEFDGLPLKYQRLMQELHTTIRDKQLAAFLDSVLITEGEIDGIGPTRISALASFGVETANDIEYNRVVRVQGIGDALAKRLLAWKRKIATRFRFDPSKGIPQQDISALNARIAGEKTQLERNMRDGVAQLQQLHSSALAVRQAARIRLDAAALALDQADADLAVSRK
jgi:DNA-binding helix-hairpin-helix protein with protein kinase domain